MSPLDLRCGRSRAGLVRYHKAARSVRVSESRTRMGSVQSSEGSRLRLGLPIYRAHAGRGAIGQCVAGTVETCIRSTARGCLRNCVGPWTQRRLPARSRPALRLRRRRPDWPRVPCKGVRVRLRNAPCFGPRERELMHRPRSGHGPLTSPAGTPASPRSLPSPAPAASSGHSPGASPSCAGSGRSSPAR